MRTRTIILLAVLPLVLLPLLIALGSRYLRWRRAMAALRRDDCAPSIPAAAETRRSIDRFKTAVMRSGMIDTLWEHWLRGRTDDVSHRDN